MASHFFRTAFYATAARKSINLPFAAGRTAATLAVGLSFGAQNNRSAALPYDNLYADNFFNISAAAGGKGKGLLQGPLAEYREMQRPLTRNFSSLQTPLVQNSAMTSIKNRRYLSSKDITKNMTLYTTNKANIEVDPKTLAFKKPTGNPLVLMMAWLMAKQKHLKKYAQIYTEMGFDVMVVHITPWQLLWPAKGTQVVAAETLKFLENNKQYEPIVMHGFSVGAYQLGEIMLQMSRDMDRYGSILDRFVCQIWDSAADITEIPVGLPKSIFPKNERMQSALRNYTLYHLKTFHNQATIHYMRSSQMFHSTLLKAPALFFVSDNDPIGPPSSNHAVRENWERANIKVTFKCWERSQHAAHLIKHRDEYLDTLFQHLESCGVLEAVGVPKRAKL
ncbi:transmembrane protein 53 isoform X1 [Drosophila nasuta]|uniref:Transmembrane protein 53 n=1 Tax=Drosophila albomicans TaxID=7291 RepID=A0A6P8X4E4_DROAB|nr:transmembrane protein 53 [Drosophila albomicans]XP_060660161.1 transmembrane protein 53 isoform X1 [Drosophila nasuta]